MECLLDMIDPMRTGTTYLFETSESLTGLMLLNLLEFNCHEDGCLSFVVTRLAGCYLLLSDGLVIALDKHFSFFFNKF